jgi:salicylate hydroxylase
VGAGIQVSPNATRLLFRWGLGPALAACAVEPAAIVFRRYDTGVRVGYTSWGARMARDHGAPYYHIHRADYHAMLHRLARAAPGVWRGALRGSHCGCGWRQEHAPEGRHGPRR